MTSHLQVISWERHFYNTMNKKQIDRAMQVHLENRRVINWTGNEPLCAIKIRTGAGNCLLDAVSVATFGTEQRKQQLERDIRIAVMNRSGFLDRLDERFIIKTRSNTPELSGTCYGHISPMDSNNCADPLGRYTNDRQLFIVANVLRCPIILLCEESAGVSSPDGDLPGVYLPLLCHPDECLKTPILLAHCDHFVPLVCMNTSRDASSYIPLVTSDFSQLPIRFLKPDEESSAMEILQRYLVVDEMPHVTGTDSTMPVLVAKLNSEESASWLPYNTVTVPDAVDTHDDLVDCREELAEETNCFEIYNPSYNSRTGMLDSQQNSEFTTENCSPKVTNFTPDRQLNHTIIDDIPQTVGTIAQFHQNGIIRESAAAGGDSDGGVCNSHHANPSQEKTTTSRDDYACDVDTDDSDEEDTCSYPNCDKPAEWWPFCFRHSPDSGYAPGALLDSYEKFMEKKNDRQPEDCDHKDYDQSAIDESDHVRQTCDADHSKTPAIVECASSGFIYNIDTDDSDEEDTCSYPNCDKPAEWWPFCFRHSPDSGYAPGALLDSYEKFMEKKNVLEQKETPTCNEEPISCTNTSDIVEMSIESQTCHGMDSRLETSQADSLGENDEEEDDTCVYPGCERSSELWPFCYEHSPDSGLAPGALLDAFKKYQETSLKKYQETSLQKYQETQSNNVGEITNEQYRRISSLKPEPPPP